MSIPRFASISTTTKPGRSAEAPNHRHRGKRKRDKDPSVYSGHNYSPPVSRGLSSSIPLDRTVAEEYRIAGLPFDQSLDPFPFPHASIKESPRVSLRRQGSETSLGSYSESSYDTPSQSDDDETVEATAVHKSSSSPGLRQRHYTVLTSLLHRCLLEKDYTRASRAWGMLLRLEINGHPLNIRDHERWGIGAELLFHSDATLGRLQAEGVQPNLDNLMRAKDYYERLILQYPYRKTSPDSISSLTFYPVMFGIWIYAIQLRYKVSMQETLQGSGGNESAESSQTADDEREDLGYSNADAQIDAQHAICQRTILRASEIIERLTELLISPPYSDHPGLWKVQGMLYLWIHQLSDHCTMSLPSHPNREEHWTSPPASFQGPGLAVRDEKPAQSESYLGNDQQERQKALLNAKEALSRALKLGGTIDTRIQRQVGL
ncbi:MAG: hypothetical protein Q9166_003396 [cf. Caloplaca sp. 2 TL-2023]